MSKIAKIVLVLVATGVPVAAFVFYMGLPGLSDFTEFPLPVKLAYVGCALAAVLIGPGGLAAAVLGKTVEPTYVPASDSAASDSADSGSFDSDDGFASNDGFDDDEFGDDFEDESGFDDFDDDEFA